MSTIRTALDRLLPEGRFKDFLRRCYSRYYNPSRALNKIVAKAELLRDTTLFIELNNGTKYSGKSDEFIHPCLDPKCRSPQELRKLKGFEYFGTLLMMLFEEYVLKVYEPKQFTFLISAIISVEEKEGKFSASFANKA